MTDNEKLSKSQQIARRRIDLWNLEEQKKDIIKRFRIATTEEERTAIQLEMRASEQKFKNLRDEAVQSLKQTTQTVEKP